MPSTRSTMDALLKDFYLPGVRKTLNDEVFLLSQIEAKSDRVEGRQVVVAVRTSRNQGVGARGESGTLPTAGQQGITNAKSTLAYNYGRIQVSGPMMRSITSDRGGFARPLETETRGVVTDLKNDTNRQLYGDGTGTLCTTTAGATSTATLTVALSSTQLRQVVPGMFVDLYTGAGVLSSAGRTIVSVTASAIVLDSPVTSASGSKLYRAGSKDQEMDGLAAIVSDTGTYLTIDPTTVPVWASTVNANGGTPRAANEDLFYKAWQDAHIASGDEIKLWITSPGIHRAVAADLLTDRRINNTVELKGGYQGIDISAAGQGRRGGSSVALVYDKDAPTGRAYGICPERVEFQRASDWEFMEEDGAVLSRVPGTDAYEATLFCYAQPVTDSRASHAVITDLSDS